MTIKVRNGGGRLTIACATGCDEGQIAKVLGVTLTAVPNGSGTSQNRGDGTRFHPLKGGTGTGTGSRAAEETKLCGTTLPPFEMLDSFRARVASTPDPTWLIKDLVPDLGNLLITAAPSAGKTFLCLLIAKAAAERGRVVYLVLEEGNPKATAARFDDLKFGEGLPVLVLHLAGITIGAHAAALTEMLARGLEGPAPVLVLDPFTSVFSGNENDTEQVSAARAALEMLMRTDPRLLLVIPHHTSKGGERGETGTSMYKSRGSTVLPAWADVQLNLTHVTTEKGSGRVEFDAEIAKNRNGERDYIIRIGIDLGSGDVAMKPATEARHEAKQKGLRDRLVHFIRTEAEPLTKNKICAGVSGNKQEKLALIDELTAEGVLSNAGSGWTVAKESSP